MIKLRLRQYYRLVGILDCRTLFNAFIFAESSLICETCGLKRSGNLGRNAKPCRRPTPGPATKLEVVVTKFLPLLDTFAEEHQHL